MPFLVQKFIVEDAASASSILPQHVALVNPDGSPVELGGSAPAAGSVTGAMIADKAITKAKIADGVIPTIPGAATTTALGLMKKASGVASVASSDSAASAGDAPTKAEFDKVVAEVNETKKQLNALLASLKAAGVTA